MPFSVVLITYVKLLSKDMCVLWFFKINSEEQTVFTTFYLKLNGTASDEYGILWLAFGKNVSSKM
jgi:hypothetical protein